MAPLTWMAVLWLGASPAPARVFVSGHDALQAALLEERPELDVTRTATAADLVFELVTTASRTLVLRELTDERTVEERRVGTARDAAAALRLAVLMITERVDAYTRPLTEPPPRRAPVDHAVAPPSGRWLVNAGVSGGVAAGARVGATGMVGWRDDVWLVGARASGWWCCGVTGDNVEADALSIAGMIELRRALWSGPVDVGLRLSAGVVHHSIEARAVGIFAGPAGPEATQQTSALGRAAVSLELPLQARIGLTLDAGVELHTAPWSVRLPPPYDAGRAPLDSGFLQPFAELGLSVDFADPT